MGAGFDKPANTRYFALRFPRVLKIHDDHSFKDTVSFEELQEMARRCREAPEDNEREETHWLGLVMEKKTRISLEELCDKEPQEIAVYMDHVRSLRFEDKPDYSYLRKIFQSFFVRQGFEYDNVIDWTMKRYVEQQEIQPRGPQKETVSGP
jgi:hypothetical protein